MIYIFEATSIGLRRLQQLSGYPTKFQATLIEFIMHFKGTLIAFEATSIALWLTILRLPQLIWLPKDFEATLIDFEDTSKES